jgi:hypothetical protein
MSHWVTHRAPTLNPPGIAQWLGRGRLVPGSRRSPYHKAHWAATRPPMTSTQPLLAYLQVTQPGLPTCRLLWGQAAARYFPL